MQFYAASNVCAPSRRAILTGRYPGRLGEWAEAYRTTPKDTAINAKDEPCFPLFLKQAGYVNGMFGKWNVGSVNGVSTPDAQGFDYWIGSHHNTSYFLHRIGGELEFWENGKSDSQGVTLKFNLSRDVFNATYPQITSEFIGSLVVPGMGIETADGKPLDVVSDYYGKPIKTKNVMPGPLQGISAGTNTFKLWPKSK